MQKNIRLGRIRSINFNVSLSTIIAGLFALLLLLVSLFLLNQFYDQQQQSQRNEMLLTGWQEQLLTATPAAVAREQLLERLMIEQQRFASASELLPGPDADLAILQRINEAAERSGILLTTLQEVGEFQEGALIGWKYKLGAISSLARLTDFTARLEQEAFPVAYFTDDTILSIQDNEEYVLAGTLIIYGSTFSTAELALPPTIAPEQMGQELQRRAKHALALQDYELALSLLLQLAAFEPENSGLDELLYETYFQYGLYLLNEDRPSLAKEQCEAARTIDPTDERAVNCLLALEEAVTPTSAIVVIETETNGSQSTAVSGTAVSGTAISATPSSGTPQPSETATSDSGTDRPSPTASQEGVGQSTPSPTRTNTVPPTATQRASATRLPPTVAPPPTRTAVARTATPDSSNREPSNTPIPSDTPIPSNTPIPSETPKLEPSNTPRPSNTPQANATSTTTEKNTPSATSTEGNDTPTVTGTPPTNTPTVTGTPPTETPTVADTDASQTPTVTGTPPTETPTVTGTPPTETPTVTGTTGGNNSVPADPYGALSPFYLPNCGLTQIKGTIRDNDTNAGVNGVTVRVWYDGAPADQIYSLPTGQDPGRAAGEWDVVLAPYPKEGQWYVQVVDPNTGAGLSIVQTVYTDIGPCKPNEGGHQVVIVDFVKYGDGGPGEPVASSTITLTPSITPTPSITLTPSKTPVLSATPTRTQTITPTPTRTAIPNVYARVHDPDLEIPDGPATDGEPRAVSTINVPDDVIIRRVRVYPDIEHDDVADLDVSLIHPDGTAIRLHSRGEDPGEEVIQEWFELTGGDIALIAGKSALGDWQLEIIDRFETNVGVLRNWQLEIYSQ